MGTAKEDPRELQSTPYKEKAEKLAREWYREFDFMLADKIDVGYVMEYFFIYRFIGIYEHGQ